MAEQGRQAERDWKSAVTVGEIIGGLEEEVPRELSEDWDHVGLQLGRSEQSVRSVVLTLDYDDRAAECARMAAAELVICHHPPFFQPVYGLNDKTPTSQRFYEAARAGINLYAAHTNLDVAAGGVNDCLARCLGLVVDDVLVPLDHEKTRFTTGRRGLASDDKHVFWGQGRIGHFKQDLGLRHMLQQVNNRLETAGVVTNFDTNEACGLTAVSGGAWDADWLPLLLDKGVKTVITGEIRHHEMIELADHGIAAVAAGHAASERVVLPALSDWLSRRWPGLEIAVNRGLDYNQLVY